jgi:hypothetical protein
MGVETSAGRINSQELGGFGEKRKTHGQSPAYCRPDVGSAFNAKTQVVLDSFFSPGIYGPLPIEAMSPIQRHVPSQPQFRQEYNQLLQAKGAKNKYYIRKREKRKRKGGHAIRQYQARKKKRQKLRSSDWWSTSTPTNKISINVGGAASTCRHCVTYSKTASRYTS